MPLLQLDETVRASLIWSLSGTEYAVNVLHYLVPGATVVDANAAQEFALETAIAYDNALIGAELANVVTLGRITLRDLRVVSQPEYSETLVRTGSETANILPMGNSVCVTLRTALAGKSYRGRTYLPGWSEDANTAAGVVSPAAMLAAETFIEEMQSMTIDGNTWNLGVASLTLAQTNQVTSVEVRDNVWDTQRRRNYPGI